MNRYFYLTVIIILFLTLICCGGKKTKPDPDKNITNNKDNLEKIKPQESSQNLPAVQFYELQESVADIQRKMAKLQVQVSEYEYKSSATNYTEKLKELIDEPSPAHKITLKNGTVIEGTITKDLIDDIMVKTKVGKLTIEKKEIEFIQELILPAPHIIFIGKVKEQIFDNYHLFTGRILNEGSRRGDFVRVIFQLWGEDTQIISSDSVFVDGSQVRYESGIVTDTALKPNQSTYFSVQVPIEGDMSVSYVTRDIRWLLYD